MSSCLVSYYCTDLPLVEKPVKLPIKRKIIETEAEPENKLLDKAGEDLEVFLTAQTAFAEYECPSRTVVFKDTYLLQSQKFR